MGRAALMFSPLPTAAKPSLLRSRSTRMQRAASLTISHGSALTILMGRTGAISTWCGHMTMELPAMEQAFASKNWHFPVQPMVVKVSHRFSSLRGKPHSAPIVFQGARSAQQHVMRHLAPFRLLNRTALSQLLLLMKTPSIFLYQPAC